MSKNVFKSLWDTFLGRNIPEKPVFEFFEKKDLRSSTTMSTQPVPKEAQGGTGDIKKDIARDMQRQSDYDWTTGRFRSAVRIKSISLDPDFTSPLAKLDAAEAMRKLQDHQIDHMNEVMKDLRFEPFVPDRYTYKPTIGIASSALQDSVISATELQEQIKRLQGTLGAPPGNSYRMKPWTFPTSPSFSLEEPEEDLSMTNRLTTYNDQPLDQDFIDFANDQIGMKLSGTDCSLILNTSMKVTIKDHESKSQPYRKVQAAAGHEFLAESLRLHKQGGIVLTTGTEIVVMSTATGRRSYHTAEFSNGDLSSLNGFYRLLGKLVDDYKALRADEEDERELVFADRPEEWGMWS